jgi:hypothetical protein
MHIKKYLIVMLPTFIIGLFLLYYLPEKLKPYSLLLFIVMWTFYHGWIYIEKRTNEKYKQCD